MRRYFIELAFQGKDFSGWQIQQNAVTVQQVLERSLAVLLNDIDGTTGCGRTDAGVHASQFFVHFDTASEIGDLNDLTYRLNALLPDTISISRVFPVSSESHARFSATERTYEYHIHHLKDPFRNDHSVFHPRPLNIDLLNELSAELIGERSFESFCKVNTDVSNFNCNVTEAIWMSHNGYSVFRIRANRFLRGMVRAITGTFIQLQTKQETSAAVSTILKASNRSAAGPAAEPHGLFLTQIKYPFISEEPFYKPPNQFK